MADAKETAAETLSMLEERLARIDFVVNGDTDQTQQPPQHASATARLRHLERTLKNLAARSPAVSDIIQLHKQNPELFHPTKSQQVHSTLPPAALAQLVLAHEKLYKTIVSQLSSLEENKDIPDPSTLTKLIALELRLGRVAAKQMEHTREFAELRARSARIVEQWYEVGVLDMGEKWADWEESLRDCEIFVRRKEAAKKRENGTL